MNDSLPPAGATPPARRLLVIGLDGATPEFVFPWIEEGRLPNLGGLMRKGAWGPIESTTPPFTSMAWPVFYSGCNPGKTGILSYFDDYHAAVRKPATAASMRAKPIWRIMNEHGRRSIVVAAPITYPPEPLDGVMVSGMDAPSESSAFTHPAGLREELLERGYRIFIDRDLLYSGDTEKIYHEGVRVSRAKTDAFTRLLRAEPWDFAMVVLNEIDVISHFMTGDRVRDMYEETDLLVGRMLEAAGEDTLVLVISDHGVKPLKGRVFLNAILKDLGLLHLKPESAAAGALGRAGFSRERVKGVLQSLGLLNRLRGLVPRRLWNLQTALPAAERRLVDVDMSRTKLYFDGGYWVRHGGGGEPTAAELAAVEEALARFGGKLYRGADLYHGPYAQKAPPYIAYIPDHYIASAIGTGGWLGGTTVRPGDHSMQATAILAGPEGLVRAGEISGRLVDWAPTLLYLMGLPVPPEMDGEVLAQAVDPRVLAARPMTREQPSKRQQARDRIKLLKTQGRI